MGIAGHPPFAQRARSLLATASAPGLGKPIRLIRALWEGYRKTRGTGFPPWARAVKVPNSAKPNPTLSQASASSPFLSKTDAKTTGLGNFNHKTFFSRRLSMVISQGDKRGRKGLESFKDPRANPWAASGSKEKR